jgi:alpha-glucosidase (family GH31 glycosyl hydrolase)
MLGDDLLVAPVTEEGAMTWTAYLPGGDWVDAWSGDNYTGNQTVDTPAPLNRVPVFVRAAAWETMKEVFSPEL